MRKILITLIIFTLLFPNIYCYALDEPEEQNNYSDEFPYPKLDDSMKELKEKRRIIDQQRLEEIKAKKLEKEGKEENTELPESSSDSNKKSEDNNESIIPSLIVRLRGKHSSKYLCSYKFIETENDCERELEKILITDYKSLLKRNSLKVRTGENINFEFNKEPKKMVAYIWGEDNKEISLKRGCMKVPDMEGKYVIAIEATYKNGSIKYAIVLDIRK